VRLRTGRYDTAVDLLRHRPDPRDDADGSGPVRDRLLRVVLSAGLARRRGDVAAMRGLWPEIEPLLARRAVDLFGLEPLEELLVVAARLRRPERVHPLLEDLDAVVARLGRPQVWLAALGWLQLQVAVAGDDADRAATVAADARPLGTWHRQAIHALADLAPSIDHTLEVSSSPAARMQCASARARMRCERPT